MHVRRYARLFLVHMFRNSVTQSVLLLASVLAAAVCLRLYVIGGYTSDTQVVAWRAWRVLTACVVGLNLGLAGVLLQCLLRNPLASPDLLGLASGSGLAVLIGVFLGLVPATATGLAAAGNITFDLMFSLFAAIGAWGALLGTYIFSRRLGAVHPTLLVLTGVAIGVACAAGMMIVRYLLPYQQSLLADRLLQGMLREDAPVWQVVGLLITTFGIALLMLRFGRQLDAAAMSEDEAVSLGVPLTLMRTCMFVAAGALTAGTIVLAGPIGFVGLIAPHLGRKLVGPRHSAVTLPSALIGGILLVVADCITGAIELPAGRLPISAVTAIIGVPAFIWVLRGSLRQTASH